MADLYFYSNGSSVDWDDVANWWLDSEHTIPSTTLPTSTSYCEIHGYYSPIVDTDYWVAPYEINCETLFGVARYNGIVFTSFVNNTPNVVSVSSYRGSASFTVYAKNNTNITSNIFFHNSSTNLGACLSDAIFEDYSSNAGSISGLVIFNDFSSNNGVVSSAIFNNYSYNQYEILDTAEFNDYTINAGGFVFGDATFNDSSINSYSSYVKGDATFNDYTLNYPSTLVDGDAEFNGFSQNYGAINGDVEYTNAPSPITIFPTASSFYQSPVNFRLIGDNLMLNKQTILFDGGLQINLFDLLNNNKDHSLNKKTGIFLTNNQNVSGNFSCKETPQNIEDLSYIESNLEISNKIVSLSAKNDKTLLCINSDTEIAKQNNLYFNFEDDYLYLKSDDNRFLTYNGVGEEQLYFFRENSNLYHQKFDYILSENSIILFEYGSDFKNVVTLYSSNTFALSSFIPNENQKFPENVVFHFTSFKKTTTESGLKNSFIVKYDVNPLEKNNGLTVNQETKDTLYTQNYISLFPFEYPKRDNDEIYYDTYVTGLKNYQTPEYKYDDSKTFDQENGNIRRSYDKIFTGTNQIGGYDKIYLGYRANTKEITFKNDEYTYFNFPITSPTTKLSASGLIESGAIASSEPYLSDRIFVKLKSYKESLLDQISEPFVKQDGTWLCSWLSGSTDGDKKWFTRFYNAAYYSLEGALSATTLYYNDVLDETKPYVFDIESDLQFIPNVEYKYFHCGDANSKNFIENLTFDSTKNGSLVLNITSWDGVNLFDTSDYKNTGITFFNDEKSQEKGYWNLTGKNHAIFPAKNELLDSTRFTTNLWVNVDDWEAVEGSQIFGNYYNSGYGLINDSSISSPIITFVENTSGVLYNFNYNLKLLNSVKIEEISNSKNYMVQRLPDYGYWVFDRINLIGRKYDYVGKIEYTTDNTILSSYITKIDQLELDKDQNIYLFDNTSKNICVLDTFGDLLSSSQLGQNTNRFEIDLDNTLQEFYGQFTCIDNNNNYWELVGKNLYKNQNMVANIGTVQQITCDEDDNIWILHSTNSVTKLDIINNRILFTKEIGKSTSEATQFDRYINFLKIPVKPTCDNKTTSESRPVIINKISKELFILTPEGDVYLKLDLNALITNDSITPDFNCFGDFSGYQYLRKFTSNKKQINWKFKIAEPNGKNGEIHSLTHSVTGLPNGWHMFTFVFDSLNGLAEYYIDSILVDAVSFTPNRYELYYDYRSSLCLGAQSVKNVILNDVIGEDYGYKFIGKVSELSIYNKALNKSEIEQFYFASEKTPKRDVITWNIPVGERNFVEAIDKFYQLRLPGSKSQFFNLKIHNLNVSDSVKEKIENSIRDSIKKIAPLNTSLYKLKFVDK